MNRTVHVPVLPDEVMQWLDPQPGQVFADGTLGGGGHTRLLVEAVGDQGRVVAVDLDPDVIERAEKTLKGLPILLSQSSYVDLPEVLEESHIKHLDGILLDLGLSSDQLADEQRGFSFNADGPLDLRFDPTSGKSAAQLLERISAEHLANIIYQFGEERYSRRIARAICKRQRENPITTAAMLADIVRRSVPGSARRQHIDPATRTFQALRIAVNEELRALETALPRLRDCLRSGGRLAVISFHSLEDRIVKHQFRDDPQLEVLTRTPIAASDQEVDRNPRSRSAKLRVAQRI
jgi:16S rRNA (cytosine1402-N4)-methyltransferase